MQPPSTGKPLDRPSVLAVHHSAGVQKKVGTRKARVSAKARRRREKGMEMAEAVMERHSSKVQRSFVKQRAVDKRRQAWDAINRDVDEDEDEDEDEEMKEDGGKDGKKDKKDNKNKKQKSAEDEGWETDENIEVAEVADAAPAVDDDLDEIL